MYVIKRLTRALNNVIKRLRLHFRVGENIAITYTYLQGDGGLRSTFFALRRFRLNARSKTEHPVQYEYNVYNMYARVCVCVCVFCAFRRVNGRVYYFMLYTYLYKYNIVNSRLPPSACIAVPENSDQGHY